MNGLKEFKTNLKQILGNKLLGINSYEYVNHSVVKLFVNKANVAGLKHNADYLIRVNFKSV